MVWLTLADTRALQLRHLRRRTWLLIALCFSVRGADTALGLDLIEPAPPAAAQSDAACPAGSSLNS